MPTTLKARLPVLAAVLSAALIVSGCCDRTGVGSANPTVGGRIPVTTSTNVWGDVVRAVGGSAVEVTSIISDPSTDPHSYESTPSDATKVTGASLVVLNGAGYDGFVEKILESTGGKPTVSVHEIAKAKGVAAEEHDHDHDNDGHQDHAEDEHKDEHDNPPHGQPGHVHKDDDEHAHTGNEHYWYDLELVRGTAERVATSLSGIRPESAELFELNAAKFERQIDQLVTQATDLATRKAGTRVLATEPVSALLLNRVKFVDVTPKAFVAAVEEQNDPPAAAVAETQRLIASKRVALLLYNPQTESPVVRQIRDRAQAARIPVINVTETLPEGSTYIAWMTENLSNLTKAVA